MKRLNSVTKWALLLPINALPLALSVLLYRGGAWVDLYLTIPSYIVLAYLNYKATDKVLPYALIQLYGVVCLICAGYLSTRLYYNNVSSDPMTPIVGKAITLIGAGTVLLITVITVVIKWYLSSRKAKAE